MSFAVASAYRDALEAGGTRLREGVAEIRMEGELAWQARWYAGEFGPAGVTTDGRPFVIEDFGRWNRESGPDFVDARVRIDGGERRGDIELDLDARDWERHGHAVNPAFRETVLHVFLQAPEARFFSRTSDHREVAQYQLELPQAVPRRSGEARRVTADPARAEAILLAAARHRLDRKFAAWRRSALVRGEAEATFAALAVALGYKRNQTPFLLLAQRVGMRLAARSGGEAMLFGVAGFLESPEPPAADAEVRGYLRDLWESWWTERARCARWILPGSAWSLAGVRPANHPHRRVAALAGLASRADQWQSAIQVGQRAEFLDALMGLGHSFWGERFTLAAARLSAPQALLGAERATDMLLNIFYPLAVAREEARWAQFLEERGPSAPALLGAAAARHFGGAVDLRRAVIQQGLLQFVRDYREADNADAFIRALDRCPAAS